MTQTTDRRTMLKLGAVAAAPLVALVPAATVADDGTAARLALLEDHGAIRQAMRAHIAAMPELAEDHALPAEISLAPDGTAATYRRACTVQRHEAFTGQTTIEQMARFQGHGYTSHQTEATLEARLDRSSHGWAVTALALA